MACKRGKHGKKSYKCLVLGMVGDTNPIPSDGGVCEHSCGTKCTAHGNSKCQYKREIIK